MGFCYSMAIGKQRGPKGFQVMSNFAQIDMMSAKGTRPIRLRRWRNRHGDDCFSVTNETASRVQAVAHQGAALWAYAIQRAQAELTDSAKPAKRTPQPPWSLPLSRSQIHGPSIMETLVPTAKSAITTAPSSGCPVKPATNNAEYSKPQGKNVQSAPTIKGAPLPHPMARPFAAIQIFRPICSIQTGCCARQSNTRPSNIMA